MPPLLLALCLPLGSIAGTGAISINGTPVSSPGVLSWPLVSGDELLTGDPAVLLLQNNRIFLQPATRLQITRHDGRLQINLLAGKLYFRLTPDAPIDFTVLSRPVPLASTRQGALSLQKLEPGVNPPPLLLDAAAILARFPYAMGLPDRP